MSNEEKKPLEIIFAPGCFDHFDGTQEELDELVTQIQQMFDSGEAFEQATPIDIDSILDELSDEEIEDLINQLSTDENQVGENTTNRLLH